MEHVDELIAAHALHALDDDDQRLVEAHLAECERCRAQLREMEDVAAALAYAAPAAEPPPELRARVLEAIGPTVVSGAREPEAERAARWSWWPRFSMVAVPALAAAVVGLALWNVSLRNDHTPGIHSRRHVANVGSVVSYGSGQATLYANLKPAPPGKTYEAWVIPAARRCPAAGTFGGGSGISFTLTRHAAPGDTIVITIEPGTGGASPKGPVVGKAVLA